MSDNNRSGRPSVLGCGILIFMLLFSRNLLISEQKSSWEIWVVPSSYTINEGETLSVAFGITGYGPLDPVNLKILAYTEENTLIKSLNTPGQFYAFSTTIEQKSPKDRFTKKHPRAPPYSILLEADGNSGFGSLYLIPQTSGDKRLLLVATYSPDSLSWYTTSREISYHVNSFSEQWQTPIVILGLVIALFAIGPLNDLYLFLKGRWKTQRHATPVDKGIK